METETNELVLIQCCAKCHFFKPLDSFRQQLDRPPMYKKAYCIDCDDAYNQERYQRKKNKMIKNQKKWNRKHKPLLKEYKNRWKKKIIKEYYGIDLDAN